MAILSILGFIDQLDPEFVLSVWPWKYVLTRFITAAKYLTLYHNLVFQCQLDFTKLEDGSKNFKYNQCIFWNLRRALMEWPLSVILEYCTKTVNCDS